MKLSFAGRSLLGFALGAFSLASRLKPSVWIEKNLFLPSGGSEIKPGLVSFDQRPYWREPIDCIVDPSVQDVMVIAPTRMGKTFMLKVIFAYIIAVLRLPFLWYDSTVNKAISISKKELQPLVERNKCLRDRKPANKDHYTNTVMLFPSAHFEMFGANSDAQASGETAAYVLGNEVGKWRESTDKEASIMEQSQHRTETFEGIRKHIYGTTPTLESSQEWIAYREGDQRKFFVPCPHCGTMQELVWGDEKKHFGVKWDKEAKREDGSWDMPRVKASVHYRCENIDCTTPWTQDDITLAVTDERAEWRPTAEPVLPNKRSYQISGIYDHLGAHSMEALVSKFLASRKTGFLTDRRDFWNALMGLPWINDIRSITAQSFSQLELSYLRGQIPEGVKVDVYIMGADVQTWGMPWVMAGCCYTGEVYIVDWGVAAGWEDLDSVQTDYTHGAPSWVIVDMRFAQRRAETLQAIYARRSRSWVAFQGEEVMAEVLRIEKTNAFMGGTLEKDQRMVIKFVVSTYNFKIELEARYSGEMRKTFFPQLPIAADPDEVEQQRQYYAQISAEKRVPRKRKRKGLPEDEFTSPKNNHYGDCMVMIHSLLYWLKNRQTQKKRRPKEVKAG